MGLRGAVVLMVVSLTTACLITNCPKGGKRSKSDTHNFASSDINGGGDCIRCGPRLQGRCVGPAVCCGPRLGCLIATPRVLQQCENEGSLTTPHGKSCITPSGLGICAADGVCCNSESCHVDLSCELEPSVDVCAPEKPPQDNQF